MGESRDSVKVNENNGANAPLIKIKRALNSGELQKIQKTKKTRDKNRKDSSEIKAKKTVEVRAQIKYVGITEDDTMDAKFQKLKLAFDREKVESLSGLPLGAMRDTKGNN